MTNSRAVPATRHYDRALRLMRSQSPDAAKALPLLEKASAEGDPRADYAIGTWLLHGKEPVVARDVKAGVALIRKAAYAGVPDALYDLAVMLETGEGVRKNPRQALRCYLQAALHGELQSTFEVARCYHWGIGVARDRAVAKVWYARAAELGYRD